MAVKKKDVAQCPIALWEVQVSDTTDDDSSNAAQYIIVFLTY